MSFLNTVKNFIGMETDEYYDDEYYDEEMDDAEEDAPKASGFTKRASKIVSLNSVNQSRVRIMKPQSFNDSSKIADEIKNGRMVIFDVKAIRDGEARRAVDFISGVVYGIGGNISLVRDGIFVAGPRNIDITGDNVREQARNNFDWAM